MVSSQNSPRNALLITPDNSLVQELRPVLEATLPDVRIGHERSYQPDLGLLADLRYVFIDAAADPERALALLPILARVAGIQVLAVLANNDPDIILKCLRAGAVDFLLRPATVEQLRAALQNAARLHPVSTPPVAEVPEPTLPAGPKMIAVMPAKGACGATTVACNLAFHWKRAGAERVLLVDLDPLTGTVAFLLKLKSAFSFVDVLQRQSELDQDLWRSVLSTSAGVDVLLAPELVTAGQSEHTDAAPILEFARSRYDVIITDAGSVYGPWNLSQARAASDVVLVTTNELPALQSAQRALSYLDANRVPASKLRLVVNRYQRDIGLSREVISTALHADVFADIPSDYDAIQAALLEGKPVPPTSAFGRGLAQLGEKLGSPGKRSKPPTKSSGNATASLTGLLTALFQKGRRAG
jgi:pilus assembly protein CpaE